MKWIIGGLIATAALSGCGAVDAAADSMRAPEEYTCADLAKEAANIGENNLGVALLKVRDPQETKNNFADYTVPTGADDVVLLQCKGTGVFNTGQTARVKIEATIDADEDMFVSWEPIG